MVTAADIHVYQGDDYIAIVTVTNPDGTAANLTGYTAQAEIRPTTADRSEPPLAQFQCGISGNVVTIILTHAQTELLASQILLWDLQLIDSSGWITTIMAGNVMVAFEVTKIYTAATRAARRSYEAELSTV